MHNYLCQSGLHATWADADGGPKVVNAFMPREATGYRVIENWDTMGMRATSSHDFQLDGVFIPDRYVARILPAGGLDAFGLGIFAWGLLGFAHIYHAVAQRAMDLAVPALKAKRAHAVSRNLGYHPEFQHMIADMHLMLDPIGPHIHRVAEDWSNGVDHGGTWPSKIAILLCMTPNMSPPRSIFMSKPWSMRSWTSGVRVSRCFSGKTWVWFMTVRILRPRFFARTSGAASARRARRWVGGAIRGVW